MRLLALGALVLAACSSLPPAEESDYDVVATPKKSAKKTADEDDDDAPPAAPSPAKPAGTSATATEQAKIWYGALDTSPSYPFGGTPTTCKYEVRMADIKIELGIVSAGDIVSAKVTNQMNEIVIGKCPSPAAAPRYQTFNMQVAVRNEDDLAVVFDGVATNHPVTNLVVHLVRTEVGYDAVMVWKRMDQPKPFDWTVNARLSLKPKA